MNDPRREYFGMLIPDYTCEARIAQFIRRKIKKRHTTPTIQTIAQVVGADEQTVTEAIENMVERGVLKCESRYDGEISRLSLEFERCWRWTVVKRSEYRTGRDENPEIEEYGGGPIAKMPRDKQNDAINKVYGDRKWETYRMKTR